MIILSQKSFLVLVCFSSENIYLGMCHFEYQGHGLIRKNIFFSRCYLVSEHGPKQIQGRWPFIFKRNR